MHAIEIENLHKSYGELSVLRDLTLRVQAGEVYGLLGPNGAGKSTLLHLLLGFLLPSGGSLRVLGSRDVERVRGRVGYLPERLRYHNRYSAREYLRFLGQFSSMGGAALRERVDSELERVGLIGAADRLLGSFSKGMLQRLGIAQAMLADPELLLLDEPTSGLDIVGRRELFDLLAQLRGPGRTILLATHYTEEVEQLCDRVGVLTGGRVAAEEQVDQLRGPGGSVTITVSQLGPELVAQLQQLGPAVHCGEREVLLRPNSQELQSMTLQLLLNANVSIVSLQPKERPLERLFVQATRGGQAPVIQASPPAPAAEQPEQNSRWANPTRLPSPQSEPPAGSTAPPPVPYVPAPPVAPSGRSSEGDTLLNELLRRDKDAEA